jgi:tRNA C32,U32 (ribose-2'-O)-methylase TrmJ
MIALNRECADVAPGAIPLLQDTLQGVDVPERIAVVIGREADGLSPEMRAASDFRMYVPMYGKSGFFHRISQKNSISF